MLLFAQEGGGPVVLPDTDLVPPSNLVVYRYGSKYVELQWTPALNGPVHNVKSYKLYINGVWDGVTIPSVYATSTMNADKLTLTPNTLYTFEVTAVDEVGNETEPSNTVTITTPRNTDVGKFRRRRYTY